MISQDHLQNHCLRLYLSLIFFLKPTIINVCYFLYQLLIFFALAAVQSIITRKVTALVQQHLRTSHKSCRRKILRHTCNILQDVFIMRTEKYMVLFLSPDVLTSLSCKQTGLKQHSLLRFPLWERRRKLNLILQLSGESLALCNYWLESFGKNT